MPPQIFDVKPEITTRFENDFWAAIGDRSGLRMSLYEAQNGTTNAFSSTDADHARKNFENLILNADHQTLSKIAQEQINRINQHPELLGSNRDAIRYVQRIWTNVGGSDINGNRDDHGRNLMDAIGEADEYWKNNNKDEKKAFASYMANLGLTQQLLSETENIAAQSKGFDSAEEQRRSESVGLSADEKHTLDKWAQKSHYKDIDGFAKAQGFKGFDDKEGHQQYSTSTKESGNVTLSTHAKGFIPGFAELYSGLKENASIHTVVASFAAEAKADEAQRASEQHDTAPPAPPVPPPAPQPDVAQIKSLQIAIGLSGKLAAGAWNRETNNAVQELIVKGQSTDEYAAYAKEHHFKNPADGRYGSGTQIGLQALIQRGDLSAQEIATFQSLQKMGGNKAHVAAQQLAINGYAPPDAHTATELAAKEKVRLNFMDKLHNDRKASVAFAHEAVPAIGIEMAGMHQNSMDAIVSLHMDQFNPAPRVGSKPPLRTTLAAGVNLANRGDGQIDAEAISHLPNAKVKQWEQDGQHMAKVQFDQVDAKGKTHHMTETSVSGANGARTTISDGGTMILSAVNLPKDGNMVAVSYETLNEKKQLVAREAPDPDKALKSQTIVAQRLGISAPGTPA